MIKIVDVSPDPTGDGEHTCEIRLSDHVVGTFTHNDAADLPLILLKAYEEMVYQRSSRRWPGAQG